MVVMILFLFTFFVGVFYVFDVISFLVLILLILFFAFFKQYVEANKDKFDFFKLWFRGVFLCETRGRIYQSFLLLVSVLGMICIDNVTAQSLISSLVVALVFNLICIESHLEYRKIVQSRVTVTSISRLFEYNRLIKYILCMDYNRPVDWCDSYISNPLPASHLSDYLYLTVEDLTKYYQSSAPGGNIILLNKISPMVVTDALDLIFNECLSLAKELLLNADVDNYENVKTQLYFFLDRNSVPSNTKISLDIDIESIQGCNRTVEVIMNQFVLPMDTIGFWFGREAERYFDYCRYAKYRHNTHSSTATLFHLRARNSLPFMSVKTNS